jgi:hypothetical protein
MCRVPSVHGTYAAMRRSECVAGSGLPMRVGRPRRCLRYFAEKRNTVCE